MPSFPDSIFLFVLALLLFGPKRLPVLARELGKWVGEFRRASNEFKMQMEDELRLSEQADRNKQLEAMQAAAPVAAAITAETVTAETSGAETVAVESVAAVEESPAAGYEVVDGVKTAVPIAVSGELKIMPPATGLPVAAAGPRNGALTGLLEAMPAVDADAAESAGTTVHGN
jgi:sec-independent protein translocase protein TatB